MSMSLNGTKSTHLGHMLFKIFLQNSPFEAIAVYGDNQDNECHTSIRNDFCYCSMVNASAVGSKSNYVNFQHAAKSSKVLLL